MSQTNPWHAFVIEAIATAGLTIKPVDKRVFDSAMISSGRKRVSLVETSRIHDGKFSVTAYDPKGDGILASGSVIEGSEEDVAAQIDRVLSFFRGVGVLDRRIPVEEAPTDHGLREWANYVAGKKEADGYADIVERCREAGNFAGRDVLLPIHCDASLIRLSDAVITQDDQSIASVTYGYAEHIVGTAKLLREVGSYSALFSMRVPYWEPPRGRERVAIDASPARAPSM